jgi:hypothetical protein
VKSPATNKERSTSRKKLDTPLLPNLPWLKFQGPSLSKRVYRKAQFEKTNKQRQIKPTGQPGNE